MKNIVTILFCSLLFCLPLLLQAQAASRTVESEYAQLENNFESDFVAPQQLVLFQKKSNEVLSDFANTIDLISTKNFQKDFIEKFQQQAISYFSSPTDSLFFYKEKNQSGISVEKYVEGLDKKETDFDAANLTILSSSVPILAGKNYTWSTNFKLTQQGNSEKVFTAVFILKKEKKKFGKKKKEVWSVFLKKIEE